MTVYDDRGADAANDSRFDSVCVVGLGYIGLPTAAMFASSGKTVHGVDINRATVDTVNAGRAHIEEGDLDALVQRCVAEGRLRASTRPEPADAFIIAVPTPADEHTNAPDLGYVEAAVRSIAPVLRRGNLVIIESTSPVGTTRRVADILAAERRDLHFPGTGRADVADICLAYCPERIIPGRMLKELVENDRIIGGATPSCTEAASTLYRAFVRGQLMPADDRTAEMVKLTENAFRDVNIAFANELSMICADLGLDVWQLIELANRHPRVNILRPGPGVGGHCIAVDPWFIVASAPERARLVRTAREVNDAKPGHVLDAARRYLDANPGKTALCLGLTYKPDVDDFRESPALEIAATLSKAYPGRVVCADPYSAAMPASAREGLVLQPHLDAFAAADLVVMLVGHTAFRVLPSPERARLIDTVGFWA